MLQMKPNSDLGVYGEQNKDETYKKIKKITIIEKKKKNRVRL